MNFAAFWGKELNILIDKGINSSIEMILLMVIIGIEQENKPLSDWLFRATLLKRAHRLRMAITATVRCCAHT